MGTIPAPKVLLDDGSGAFPYDITSKLFALEDGHGGGYSISRGRDDWIGAVTAGELRLTLNNSDGRFTPGSTILGSPSPITVDQRIRVSETVEVSGFGLGGFGVGGFGDSGGAVRFTGYVKSWPVSWPATVTTFAEVELTATDAQARAERRTLASLPQEAILSSAGLAAYHPLAEVAGSTSAGDLTGQQTPLLPLYGIPGASYAFGTDLTLPDGSTGLTFTQGATAGGIGGQGYQFSRGGAAIAGSPTWTSPSVFVNFVYIHSAGGGAVSGAVASAGVWYSGTGGISAAVSISPAGQVTWAGGVSPSNLVDGHPYVISAQAGGGLGSDLWIDGVKVATAAVVSVTWDNSRVYLSGQQDGNSVTTFGHFAYGSRVSDAQVQDIHRGLMSVFAGDTTGRRVARIGGYAGLSLGTTETSTTTVPAQATTDVSAWTAIQEVADAEMGLAFIDGTGTLTFHNRNHVATKTVPDLILDSQYVTPEVSPVTDDQQIVNYFEATAAGTGATSLARNTASETKHGRYPVSQTYLVQTDAEALDRANWIVAKQAEPFTRYGTLTINLYKMSTTQVTTVLSVLDLNCWLRVTSLASQNPGGTVADVVVQGWNADTTGESSTVTCNVVAKSLYSAFIIGTSLLGDAAAPIYV